MHRKSLAFLRRIPALRSGWYLSNTLYNLGKSWGTNTADVFNRDYQAKPDPWGYSTSWGTKHLRVTEKILDAARTDALFQRAFEIGCGEGYVTEVLAPRCASVLAVDVAATALDRARLRCLRRQNVQFCKWDLMRDKAPQTFDLVLLMGVFENFRRPKEHRLIRAKIIELLAPGGYLLVTSVRQHEVIETALWDKMLLRGSQHIREFLACHSLLSELAVTRTSTHLFTLYRKAS
jgi:2-polyprenyl-3-methyl-5-hydroxy-6-metoxy-1,4-benzoquinol methylase